MKTIFPIRYILLLPAILFLAGCYKDLNQTPKSQLSDADFWKTPSDLKQAANYFYTTLPGIYSVTEDCYSIDANSDDVFSNNVSNGTRLTPATDAGWSNPYFLIRACNNLIEKSSLITGAEADQYRAEARFFRAWAYYMLLIRYGNVPLILNTFGLEDSLINAPRSPREEVVAAIYADLDWAADKLPHIDVQAAADYGRIVKTAAWALKARVALYEGTRQKFHEYGTSTKHLQIAVDASDAVINSGKHALFTYAPIPDSSYRYLFYAQGEGKANKENILVRLYGQNTSNNISSHNFPRTVVVDGLMRPTKHLCDAYLYIDGLPYTKSPFDSTSPDKQVRTLSQFSNRDARMGQTIFNRNLWYTSGFYSPSFTRSATGFHVAKFVNSTDVNNNVSFTDFAIIRYAEVLLINAEAKYELSGSISDADLDKTINLTRARGRLPKLTNAFVTANGLNMREEIRRERRVELALEGFRYWDLLRWKIAETELVQSVLGTKYFPAEYTDIPFSIVFNADGFVISSDKSKRKFDPIKDYLWPIPTNQFPLQPALLPQNPGW